MKTDVEKPANDTTLLTRVTGGFVYMFERLLPEPFVFAVLLTVITAVLALIFAPKNSVPDVLTGWYNGIFLIFPFAFQMVLILVTGYALTSSKPVSALLRRMAAMPKTPRGAVAMTVLVSMVTVGFNWGFGLVASAIFAREIAKRHRLDFAWLLGGAYSGFVMFPPGLSSSIALAQATPGSPLNIVQKVTGQIIPLSHSLLAPFNIVPVIVLFIVLPLLYSRIQPPDADMQPADQARLEAEDAPKLRVQTGGLAGVLDRAWIINLVLVAAAFGYLGMQVATGKFHLDINSLILIFLALGLLLHWQPIAYVEAINNAARITGTHEPWTKRHMKNRWFLPFSRLMDVVYPSGLRHAILNSATPIDDNSIQLVQILFRNDREEDCSTEELRAWDGAIILEDKDILESTNPDAIVDMSRKIEMHMPSDRPGMLMRNRLLALLKAQGETEIPR